MFYSLTARTSEHKGVKNNMGIFFLLLSIAIVIFLVFKGVPIFFAAVISSIFLLATAGMNVVDGMTGDYVTGLGNYFQSQFWVFILGAIFGNMFGVTGAADAIANAIISKLGEKAIVPAVIIVGFVLAYGGVSVFVCFFAMYPLMLSMFRKADISCTLIPGLYLAGAGTAAGMLPGSPSVQNVVPCDFLGVPYTACSAPGWITGIVEMILVFAYCFWVVRHTKAKGMHFERHDEFADLQSRGQKLPSALLSVVPMVILLVLMNFTDVGAAVALFCGVIAALVCFWRYYPTKDTWKILQEGAMGGLNSLFNTAAITGFGSVVGIVPAFQTCIDALTGLSFNPLISACIATAVLSAVCGSGSGGAGIALPIIKEYFIPMGVNLEALARCTALACLTLDSLPQNGLGISLLTYTKNTLKSSYMPMCAVTVIIPSICLVLLLALCAAFGYM
jgi:H+/gluconate symporter-like permease